MIIRIQENKEIQGSVPASDLRATQEEFKPEYLTKSLSVLRQNFETKSTPQVNVISRPILPSSFSSSSSSQSKEYSTERYASNNRIVPSTNGTELVIDESPSRSWLSGRKVKPKKTVRMNMPVELPFHPQRPHSETPPISPPGPPNVEIKDLCSTLCSVAPHADCLGYFCDSDKRQHELRPVKELHPASEDESIVSLETLLTSTPRVSRHDRYHVASILASSLLQLQSTPWLADKMEKKNIFFYQQCSKVLIDYPYVRQSFSSVKRAAQPITPGQARFAARNSLSHLGILLLELCFGEAIEKQDVWKCYLGSDGMPHQGTDYMAARDWAEMVCEEEPALEHIIKCCVFCIFEEKADWGNKNFIQAVYASVVAPLENIINKWPAT